jgi:heme ABC exporter ATP-binding subunit CcmA
MIEIKDLVKDFGRKHTINRLNLRVNDGDFLTIFGPNGSGKTTLLKLMATLLKPTSGNVSVNGHDSREEGIELRRNIGMVSHETYLYDELTAMENLRFYTALYGVPFTRQKADNLKAMLKDVALYHRMNDNVGTFSRGMKQRLAIIRASVHDPSVILLDEPYTGLDKKGSEVLNGMLSRFNANGRTIIMTTHDIEKGYNACKRLAILIGGKIVFEKSKSEIGLEEFISVYGKYLEAA